MTGRDAKLDPTSGWRDDGSWARRLKEDQAAVARLMPPGLRPLHDMVVARARAGGAQALILSGSTARGRRTAISDLDYHLIGGPIETRDLAYELDLHVRSPDKLEHEILAGDDVVQWSLRFGRVLFDDGTLWLALRLIAEERPWPDVERKREHAAKSLDLAGRVIESGDPDGALLQVRTALSLTARAFLLSQGTFPLARAELPDQLAGARCHEAARALRAAIEEHPSLDELESAWQCGRRLLSQVDARGSVTVS
jgi:hypothetical protein